MTELTKHENVYVLDLGEGDIRFAPEALTALRAALDEIEDSDAASAALVTTATGKIWHNGLDLDHLGSLGDAMTDYLADVNRIYARLLTLPVPTIAAVQGHAFAGGAMLALAHDVRVVRADRGYLCLPEVDLGMTFTAGMAALLAAKLPQPALHRMAVLGARIGGSAAVELGVAEEAVEGEAAVFPTAVGRAVDLAGKASNALAGLRRDFYSDTIDALTNPVRIPHARPHARGHPDQTGVIR